MKHYVIDASVVVKSLLNENDSVFERFSDLLESVKDNKVSLLSSKLLPLEVANGLRFSLRDKNESLKVFRDFLELPIKTYVLTKVQKEGSLQLSYDLGTTVYDTSYHVLAKAHNATFLTSDDKYYNKAKELGDVELVQ